MRLYKHLIIVAVLLTVLSGCANSTKVTQEASSPTPPSPATPTVIPISPPASEMRATATPPAQAATSPVRAPSACPVTIPNGSSPPSERPSPYYYGNGALYTVLWPRGEVSIRPQDVQPDGVLEMKSPWWRGPRVVGRLTIEGRRLDAPASPLQARIPDGYGDTGFQSTALLFPTEGCWEVTGRTGDANLTFVTLVTKA